MEVVRKATQSGPSDGLLPIFLSPDTGKFWMSDIRLGSRGDSYYEYLIKQHLQTK
jgi:mannosyl-oligosaccharide alpha-1,2-mannosidase